ncbi:Trifunctional nucleotide phosphoesterase protein YfkN precursor [Thalassovita gelatinovora]|uniref:Trifunctional nucleotide phosphoesterase protein YfkN n=1 Tax=Thalassovita gelatinovora TaxID=53501 RepID=A0A0P1FDD2_THAGE|nr:bifunctional 2',3'-cyclic-nucleotide 2'-phosphodiesterase/3'-nucleotidase [Thalassovita gelatinovora]QIZ81391.1 bifunctional 2',3'-cyclic-nucleotide 2'-phosphodiesterase/3'-nucleotidase [Thalassovita gelatinovora]CUH66165.1 Trifunctional nucleotide phosphoesterase protein YfkN precursor [Thalassovita gelatinovora]SEQ20877.1 2',3'-cyclic-nucleotide 2'-phosphodiesterase / 3'-nucleotidase [Thalassovita gelatinovora]
MTSSFSRREFLGAAAGAGLIVLHPFSARAAANQAHLRVMETTDLHVHVFPYDYYSDRPVDTVGLARTAAHIGAVRAEATNSMLVDNGDFLQGNPMGDYIAYERGMKDGDLHPVIAAMNTLGFDASTLGNHEFNYGLDFLSKSLALANFPVVSSNVVKEMGAGPRDDTTLIPPYVILDRELTDGAGNTHQIKVGLIGFVPPQIMNWDRRHLEGNVNTRDIVETAKAYVPEMKEKGADIIIALSHSGIGSAEHSDGMENASVPLAAVDGIDALMTGHSHLVFPSPTYADYAAVDADKGLIHGKPAVMGGYWGSHLGVIDLMLEQSGGTWQVVTSAVETRPIYKRNEDRSITALVESVPMVLSAVTQEHDETLSYVRRAVGKTDAPLHSYFALVADDPSVQIVSIAQEWYVAQMLEGTEYEGLPILSAAAPFKAGGRGGPDYYTDVAVGDVAIKNVADLYLYPNTARAVLVSGQQVKDWLERSAGIFNQIEPGKPDQVLLNPSFPSYNFDVIDGVEYQIDLSQPSKFDTDGAVINPGANRIVNLSYNGAPLDMAAKFVIATNNYRAGGGGKFPGADGSTTILTAPDTNRDVIVRYIVEQGTISPSADANWTFAAMPGTSVLFDTGPKAAAYADKVQGVKIAPAGDGPDGFARFRIEL